MGRTSAGCMHGSSPGGKSSFMGCFALGLPGMKSPSRQTPLFWEEERMEGDFWCFLTQEKAVAKPGLTSPGHRYFTRMGTNLSCVLLALKAFFTGPNQPPTSPSWGPAFPILGCSCRAVTATHLKKINPYANQSRT